MQRLQQRKKTEELIDKRGNKKIVRFLHGCKLNANKYNEHIYWNRFRNIEYLVKDDFGEYYPHQCKTVVKKNLQENRFPVTKLFSRNKISLIYFNYITTSYQ